MPNQNELSGLPRSPVGPPERRPGGPPRRNVWQSASRAASRTATLAASSAGKGASAGSRRLTVLFGGQARARVIVVLASVLALSSADTATVGAAATSIRKTFTIGNADIGLLVAVTAVVGAIASLPFGMLADRVSRTRTLSFAIVVWGAAMLWSATARSFDGLLLTRLPLGIATAAAGPVVASLIGDFFTGERGAASTASYSPASWREPVSDSPSPATSPFSHGGPRS